MLKTVLTSDNSNTLYVPDLDEYYHSIHGAIQESRHVFINEGLSFLISRGYKEIDIFEVGFGTGLNALLTWVEAESQNVRVNYYSIEKFPVPVNMALNLNFSALLALDNNDYMEKLHNASWDFLVELSPNFSLKKNKNDLQCIDVNQHFDLVYYDAFGPRAQPEMWLPQLLKKSVDLLKDGGIWVSYCAKGQVKRDLKSAGLQIESIPGPPGKREMTRGCKIVL
ncbi:MAG: tRNA (5-methylaminomethyl-2-thiouridine)(34)-methyltransferase MnmD [Flavobacteriales bacterium]